MAISRALAISFQKQSWIRKMFEEGIRLKALYGPENVFDFSLGNPDIRPPKAFFDALRKVALSEDAEIHRYMPNGGFPEVRAKIAKFISRKTDLPFEWEDIIMTVGAGGAMNVSLKTLLDPGDEVIVLKPFFVEYNFYIDNHGGTKVVVDTAEGFLLDLDAIERGITSRTKAVILNPPNNPTGRVYPEAQVEALGELLRKASAKIGHIIYLISDEPYRYITYDGVVTPWTLKYYENTIMAFSHSKDLSLPGERIGYMAISPHCQYRKDIIGGATFLNRTLGYINAPAIMQLTVADLQGITADISIYERRRNRLYNALTSFGYHIYKPEGTFYLFPKSPIEDDIEFTKAMLKRNVLVTPGTGFMQPGYFRISFSVDDAIIEGSLSSFEAAAKEFGLK